MKGKKGFTLVELLVVILIIGILASIAIPKYEMSIKRARVMELVSMLDQLQKAVDMYRHEHDGNMGTNVARYLNVKFEGFTKTGDFYCNQRKVCYSVDDSGDITVGQYQDNFTGTGVSEYEVFASHSDNGWGRYYSGDPDLQGMRLEELGFQEDDDA